MPASVSLPAGAHHGLPAHEVVLLLETDPHRGLSNDEAAERLERFGPNALPAAVGAGVLVRIVRQFHHPLIYVLLVAGLITAGLGEFIDSTVVFAVVVVSAIVGFVQESRAEAALESLRSMVRTYAKVRRDGQEHTVPSDELVPGDLVVLEAGDKVPADARLLRAVELRVDESALTGESVPVTKDEVVALPESTPVADRRNMAYSGTLVAAGSGAGIVVATGAQTELGEIHRLVGAAKTVATPLTEKLTRFSKILTVGILALAALTFGLGLLRRQDAVETFTAAVALAVGAIPEGLPAAVTITLAIGVARMAKRRAVIRRLPAVETLGSTTVICADKTGTLTQNQLTVQALWTPDGAFEATGSGYAPDGELRDADAEPVSADSYAALRWSLLAGACCNDAALVRDGGRWDIVGDPTEGAMVVVAVKAGLDPERIAAALPRAATIPFSSERQFMATLHRDDDDQVVLVKGAIERMLELCGTQMSADGTVGPLDHAATLRAAEELAARGLRVLATGLRRLTRADDFTEDTLAGTLTLTGLQAMMDRPRPAAPRAVAACHSAGIAVKMITGDHAGTATVIAGEVGLLDGPRRTDGTVLTGVDLAALAYSNYPDAVDRASVFARVSRSRNCG